MINPADDGVTHVNVYSRAATELGRRLSNFAYSPFALPDDGKFASVEAYWYWLSCKDDRLRPLAGFAAKQLGRNLRANDWPAAPDFKQRILCALTAKYEQNADIPALLRANTLPFLHYYVFGTKVYDETAKTKWMLDHWLTLR